MRGTSAVSPPVIGAVRSGVPAVELGRDAHDRGGIVGEDLELVCALIQRPSGILSALGLSGASLHEPFHAHGGRM